MKLWKFSVFWTILSLCLSRSALSQLNDVKQNGTAFSHSANLLLEPLTSSLDGDNLNPLFYAGSDIGAKINAAFAACNYSCTVRVPPGKWNYSTVIVLNKPGQNLVGAGTQATFLHYTSTASAILWQMVPFSIQKAGTLKGLTITATAAATSVIHSGSLVGSIWEDLVITGATGNGEAQILLENYLGSDSNGKPLGTWTERNSFRNVHLGDSNDHGNATGGFLNYSIHFVNNGGATSFGFNDFSGIYLNIASNRAGYFVDVNTLWYDSKIEGQVNGLNAATGMELFRVAGTATGNSYNYRGEITGGSGSLLSVHVLGTGQMTGNGFLNLGCPGGSPCGVVNENLSRWDSLLITASAGSISEQVAPTAIVNWRGTGQTVNVYPYLFEGIGSPYTGGFGFLTGPNGSFRAPYVAIPGGGPNAFCVHRIIVADTITPFIPEWCADSDGNTVQNGNMSSLGVLGPATAPTGVCQTNGAWVFSQDGHATFCSAGTWATKI